MNLFQNVKYGVSCREAAERYGVSVNRQGKPSVRFTTTGTPACMWQTIIIFVLPAAHMGT